MKPMNLSGWDEMYNVDGYATWSGMGKPKIISYDQLFRNGIYEVYTSTLFSERDLVDGRKIVCMYGFPFIPDVLIKIMGTLAVLKRYQIEPPFIVSLSMLGIKDAVIYATTSWGRPFLTDEIYLPPTIIPTYEADIYNLLKPTFDIIWQSVSESQSPPFTPTGK